MKSLVQVIRKKRVNGDDEMTKTTREMEAKKNESTMWVGIISSIIFSIVIMLVIMMFYVDYRLKDVPTRICHNETIIENVNFMNKCLKDCHNNPYFYDG